MPLDWLVFCGYRKPGLPSFGLHGGEGGIRTLDTGLGYTPLAGERLQPLGHLTRGAASYHKIFG